MKYDKKTTFSGRFTDKIRNKFNEIDPDEESSKTTVQVIEEIIDDCDHMPVDKSSLEEIEALRGKIDAIEAERLAVNQELEGVNSMYSDLDKKYTDTVAECKKWEQIAKETTAKLQALELSNSNLEKGVYKVYLPPMADELIQVTVNRLREKFGVPDLTPAILLVDLFVKYTAKRPSDFAYPFVISKDEFRVIMSRYTKE